jgi:hypothetical protein
MAKAGMRRPDPEDPKAHGTEQRNTFRIPNNTQKPVPELGKSEAYKGKSAANVINQG